MRPPPTAAGLLLLQLLAGALGGQLAAEQLLLGGRCGERASCANWTAAAADHERRPCQCDAQCARYDDCCRDGARATSLSERRQLGRRALLERRAQWHCHRVNPIFGDVLLKASCSPDWATSARLPANELELVRRRCEHPRRPEASQPEQLDPIGMMMPISELTSGVTYANSYCLRCNLVAPKASKLLYWSPLLECNYDLDADDRNQLYDLISSSKGRALHYSAERNRWLLRAAGEQNATQRTCSITATVPELAEPLMRFCRQGTIDTCPPPTTGNLSAEAERARLECEFGHQALAFGQTSGRAYFNPACARCHRERQLLCDPRARPSQLGAVSRLASNGSRLEAPLGGLGGDAARSGASPALAGSFSVLMDLYLGGELEGAHSSGLRQCPEPNQLYDPFYLTCRDLVCGLELRLDGEGQCVAKFQPAMVYVTTCCLAVSILSLTCYLLLFGLSLLDLRPLLIDMAQWDSQVQVEGAASKDKLGKQGLAARLEDSRDSGHSTSTLAGARGQSLSSRGVACLASALLAAYLLFILGHQPSAPAAIASGSPGCRLLAAATCFCFLLAFNWMFLLAYDVWRTLRLATCQLRGPALHSQSARFLTYTLFAWLSAALVVGLALALDWAPLSECPPASECPQVSPLLHLYRPKFGQRPGSCWFANRRALALFFGLPVALIMLANLLFFIHSSYMVIRTSSRSSRHLNRSPRPQARPQSGADSPDTPKGAEAPDYGQQNSLTTSSIMSIKSQLSNASSSSSSSSSSCSSEDFDEQPAGGATGEPPGRRPLAASQSQSSLGNHSLGGASIAASLATKYDAHLSALGSVMGSLLKDYRLYCRLSTIMGLTWLTGLAATAVDQSELLWYLFVVLNTLQGLFIFIAFGCKRSKLANLATLLAYLRHRLGRLQAAKSPR